MSLLRRRLAQIADGHVAAGPLLALLVRARLEEGAVGLSAGLTYAPGMYATDAELVALCEVMAGTGAFYCPHHRNYGSEALAAYRDSIEIARVAHDLGVHRARPGDLV